MQMSKYSEMSLDELGNLYSDFHKDVFGFRPRDVRMNDKAGLIRGLERIDAYFDAMKMTAIGRNSLRDQGWVINEPATAEQDEWVDPWEEMKREEDEQLALEKKEAELEAVNWPGKKYEQYEFEG